MMEEHLQEQGHDQDRLRAGLLLSGPWTGCTQGPSVGFMSSPNAKRRANEDRPQRGCQ